MQVGLQHLSKVQERKARTESDKRVISPVLEVTTPHAHAVERQNITTAIRGRWVSVCAQAMLWFAVYEYLKLMLPDAFM
eukprot:517352-Amphidinium_carterae.2